MRIPDVVLRHPVETLIDLLYARAHSTPDKIAYSFISSDELRPQDVTYIQLLRRALAIAVRLKEASIVGSCAMLLYPAGLDFIYAFFGSMLAGVIPVPSNLPLSPRHVTRVNTLAIESRASRILTTTDLVSKLTTWSTRGCELAPMISTDECGESDIVPPLPILDPKSVAYLQYTSGSTSNPKGVMISHRNVLVTCRGMDQACVHDSSSVIVSWVPHFHDLGLVYGILQPLFGGFRAIVLSPGVFVQSPVTWLRTISQFGGTHSMGPDFAYALCADEVSGEDRVGLDLSSWKVAINGAEPVRRETLERFSREYGPFGFNPRAFCPAYGLAEATLQVTVVPRAETYSACKVSVNDLTTSPVLDSNTANGHIRTLVSCGRPTLGVTITIVDPRTRSVLDDKEVGEIWVQGEGVAEGVWSQHAATQESLLAHTSGNDAGTFLRTGDLGFVKDGELFIVGRLKDVIIIRGRNYYPEDIEEAVEGCHPALKHGSSAAFSVEYQNQEVLVFVQEVKRTYRKTDLRDVLVAIRRVIVEAFDLRPQQTLLCRPGSVPKTSSGKVQRKRCRELFLAGKLTSLQAFVDERTGMVAESATQLSDNLSSDDVRSWIKQRVANLSGVEPACVNCESPFTDFGIDSRVAVTLSGELSNLLGRKLPPSLLYDYPTINAVTQHLSIVLPLSPAPSPAPYRDERIAIIGMACRFPGAPDLKGLWTLLCDGQDGIHRVPRNGSDTERCDSLEPGITRSVNCGCGGCITGIEYFDDRFFGIAPNEARHMDPQQRLLLQLTWHALEDAGLLKDRLARTRVGVFVGISTNDYGRLFKNDADIGPYTTTGNAASIAANRLSYCFDWIGPSLAIDTACSSSLVAVHQACRSLRNCESSLAIAAGVNIILGTTNSISLSQARLLAPDGKCKAFDSRADGYVRSDGVGVVVLKRLQEALRDGDRIYAVIRGSAVNQDGRSNGLRAPNRLSQVALLRDAYSDAQVSPKALQYVEAHGSGTQLGDYIEASALNEVLSRGRADSEPCFIGSVKSNIGHAESAAGIAGLIKASLALHHSILPRSLHFSEWNPHIKSEKTCLVVLTDTLKWKSDSPKLAGVSSFGFGGTNAHVVLEEAPPDIDRDGTRYDQSSGRDFILPISAASSTALQMLLCSVRDLLAVPECPALSDLCFTAAGRRTHHRFRAVLVGASRGEMLSAVNTLIEQDTPEKIQRSIIPGRQVALLFPESVPKRETIEAQLLQRFPRFEQSVTRLEAEWRHMQCDPQQKWLLTFQIALAQTLAKLGIIPAAVLGIGLGKLSASYLSGAVTLSDVADLISSDCLREQRQPSIDAGGEPLACVHYCNVNEVSLNLLGHDLRQACSSVGRSSNSPQCSAQCGGSERKVRELTRELADVHQIDCFITAGDATKASTQFRQLAERDVNGLVVECFTSDRDAEQSLLNAIGSAYCAGINIRWHEIVGRGRFIGQFPQYPFDKRYCWIPTERGEAMNASTEIPHTSEPAVYSD